MDRMDFVEKKSQTLRTSYFVCSLDFEAKMIANPGVGTKLLPTAIPTLNLPLVRVAQEQR